MVFLHHIYLHQFECCLLASHLSQSIWPLDLQPFLTPPADHIFHLFSTEMISHCSRNLEMEWCCLLRFVCWLLESDEYIPMQTAPSQHCHKVNKLENANKKPYIVDIFPFYSNVVFLFDISYLKSGIWLSQLACWLAVLTFDIIIYNLTIVDGRENWGISFWYFCRLSTTPMSEI